MFDHPFFEKHEFENVPLNRDIFLMGETWLEEYEQACIKMFNGGEFPIVGYISYAAVRSISASNIELSWYPNTHTRFHEVQISLPRSQFIVCVDYHKFDGKPHLFIKDGWLDHIHLRFHSIFVLIDAIGVKAALNNGDLTREKLLQLRERIDGLAAQYPDVSFISFADSLLLKSNWQVGQYNSKIKYTYEPEIFVRLVSEIQSVYCEVLGLNIYAILTQGSNVFYEDSLLHISSTQNHVSLNSLGLPFAQLMSIDDAVRNAIRNDLHRPAQLYMDDDFFHSLRFDYEFQKESCEGGSYRKPLHGDEGQYFFSDCQTILCALRKQE